jgi:hypothetical protein
VSGGSEWRDCDKRGQRDFSIFITPPPLSFDCDKQKEKFNKNYIKILGPLGFYNKASLFPVLCYT